MQRHSTIASWFLNNPTAANLLMVVCILGGIVATFTMRQEVFPNAELDTIEISVEYRGATASEVESQVVQPIEQSINTLLDIRTVVSEIQAGGANIFVMLESSADPQRTLDEIRGGIDGLNSLPVDMDPPTITRVREFGDALEIGFYGFESHDERHAFSKLARERMLALTAVGQVEVEGAGEPEITIRVSPERVRLYGISLDSIAAQIQRASLELSGGSIRSSIGEYGIATGINRRYAHEFADIAIIESSTGSPLMLSQIADIENGYRPNDKRYVINGSPGVYMTIYASGSTSPAEISESVRALLVEIEAEMPVGGTVIFDDDARSFADRVGILMDSALIGLTLVLILLFLVLESRVAFWVAVGLPVAMLGGVALFALTPYTINFISVFAFIIVIGIVVDDAMVIGESIYAGMQNGLAPIAAAENTLTSFSAPITLAIITNIIAFLPIFYMPGQLGLFLLAIPVVTTCVFIMSLVEALWILPAHLAHGNHDQIQSEEKRRTQVFFETLRDKSLIPFLQSCLAERGMVIIIGLSISGAIFSWVMSGRMSIALQPAFESQEVHVSYSLNPGASERQVDDMAKEIERTGREVLSSLADVDDVLGTRMALGMPASHQGEVTFSFVEPGQRTFTISEFVEQWRDRIGQPGNLTQLAFDYQQGPGDGRDLVIEIAHTDHQTSRLASETLVRRLQEIAGVGQISYSGNAFRSEVRFELTTMGRTLGFDESEISSRLRAQLDGLEATRFTRGNDEIRVMIRGDRGDSATLPNLNDLILISSEGRQAVLGDIANISWEQGAVQSRRINGQRVERVEATIDQRVTSKNQVEELVEDSLLPQLEAEYPGLTTWDEAIDTDEDDETAEGLLIATAAVLAAIFVLVGAYVRSLRYGAVILSTIPLSASGAILGHLVLGEGLSAASFLGVLALGGLVINAGLLLHVRYNDGLLTGKDPASAMVEAVRDRFRPIVLSSVTTLVGLAPLIFSTSIQAAAMRPVAMSIGFGMLFSIPVILILMPCIVVAMEQRVAQPADNRDLVSAA
ncbi:MAG: efflux RND transporter permease subunit [Gammaproteobacteria bacterium]|nr:efflux RND transporter permease subunit [Gammaproteobacteria bacterium]MDP6734464.1 efflux RND transporter permease subunit [Gammaproteobacteria bacterium]